jgi:hypothetical protein
MPRDARSAWRIAELRSRPSMPNNSDFAGFESSEGFRRRRTYRACQPGRFVVGFSSAAASYRCMSMTDSIGLLRGYARHGDEAAFGAIGKGKGVTGGAEAAASASDFAA